MGEEDEAAARRQIFAPYQVNRELISLAAPHALFMHCLPAHREDEVTTEVIESPASVVFDQAENRLHTQKALAADASRADLTTFAKAMAVEKVGPYFGPLVPLFRD